MAEKKDIEEIFSRSVRAGRRTYFFDVRSTRAGDYYMTITESKRDFNEDGTPFYKKHKLYLYKEDFVNFSKSLNEVSEYIIKEKGEEIISEKKSTSQSKEEGKDSSKEEDASDKEVKKESSSDFTEVNFEDLGKD